MMANRQPDYALADLHVISDRSQLTAIANPLRGDLLDLLLERAMTVTELANAVGRPGGTIAHHVDLLVHAGLVHVVRTRRVRAIDERFYGRVARNMFFGRLAGDDEREVAPISDLVRATAESSEAHANDELKSLLVHARIPHDRAHEFWLDVQHLVSGFVETPSAGNQIYGIAVGFYPVDLSPRI